MAQPTNVTLLARWHARPSACSACSADIGRPNRVGGHDQGMPDQRLKVGCRVSSGPACEDLNLGSLPISSSQPRAVAPSRQQWAASEVCALALTGGGAAVTAAVSELLIRGDNYHWAVSGLHVLRLT